MGRLTALVGEGEVEGTSDCQSLHEMMDVVSEAGWYHSWAEKGEVGDWVGDVVEAVPVAEVVNEVGVEKWDAVAGEAGTGYVAEFG